VIHAHERDLELREPPPAAANELVSSTLELELQYSLPEDLRSETGESDLSVWVNDEYAKLHADLLGGSADMSALHQLGGAPQEVQHSLFLRCQLASNGRPCGDPEDYKHPLAKKLAPGAADWRLLLQIDSDEDGPGWMWGDSGRLYFCMHREDLAARRFERTWCAEQCH
jgi:hypothetical protein